jgi:5-deoxy-glucuronate isomerase
LLYDHNFLGAEPFGSTKEWDTEVQVDVAGRAADCASTVDPKPTNVIALEVFDLYVRAAQAIPGDDRERAIVVLSGTCSVRFPRFGHTWTGLGKRSDVFDGRATTVYVPRNQPCYIIAETQLRVVVVSAVALKDRAPYVILPADVCVERRGREAWTREVHNILGPEQPADRILLGETFSGRSGVWSGYPPHKHDQRDPPHESRLDELFFIQIRPSSGFGILIQYLATDDNEQTTVLHDGDIVSVSEGFHSIVAAGGHSFYYLWALAGEERVLVPRTDPRHKWLLNESVAPGV